MPQTLELIDDFGRFRLEQRYYNLSTISPSISYAIKVYVLRRENGLMLFSNQYLIYFEMFLECVRPVNSLFRWDSM